MSAPASAKSMPSKGPSPAVMATYGRQDVVFERGEGSWLVSTEGERYLDFTSGIAVNGLGHCHPHLVKALTDQANTLWHTSNLYRVKNQERLAERLVERTFADCVFFCNSGAEACEGAIKVARKYHAANGQPERFRIITFEGAFHGRTLATLAAGGNAKYLEGFGPKVEGFDQLTGFDLDAVARAIVPATAAIMIEPVQMEGGVRVVSDDFMRGLRTLCDRHGLLLVLDEVQSGMGRSGKLFHYEWSGIKPDVMAIAKAIGGGFPLGAFLATKEAAKGMVPGTHGSTFGGNPLATAVGNAVLDIMLAPGFLEEVTQKGLRLKQLMAALKDEQGDAIEEVRGHGLLAGVRLKASIPAGDVMKAATAEKLLTVSAGDNVIRLLPSLTVSEDEMKDGIARLSRAITATKKKA
ncbi:MAG: aspartate aminotransferase family protein [Hyphomicrobiaceae bacterium]|nr:aspartate aminotransferase family protein [Hyphomicrobiaceae bacterium]